MFTLSGYVYHAQIIVWMDAKFSGGHEKSYCKFAVLCPELYHLHRSNIGRLVDIEGHESGMFRVGSQLVVCFHANLHIITCCREILVM